MVVIAVEIDGSGILDQSAIAVADCYGVEASSSVNRRSQVSEIRRVSFNKQDIAIGTDGRDHVDVESFFNGPIRRVLGQRRRQSLLVYLSETAVTCGAGRQTKHAAIR